MAVNIPTCQEVSKFFSGEKQYLRMSGIVFVQDVWSDEKVRGKVSIGQLIFCHDDHIVIL